MVDVDYLCIAVRNIYKQSKDFEKVYTFLDTLYTSGRIKLPLTGILICRRAFKSDQLCALNFDQGR